MTRSLYDLVDRLVQVSDPAGRITDVRCDSLGRRSAVLNTAIQALPLEQRGYTPNSQLATLTDAIGTATSYSYDGFDRLDRTTYADASFEQNGYDLGGNVLTRRTRAGDTIAFAYDTLNRLTTKTPPSPAPVVSYRYDLTGRLTGVSDTGSTVTMAQWPSGVTSVAYAANYSYDALNRLTKTSFQDVAAATTPATSSVGFTHGYNAVNQRVSQQTTDDSWWYVPSALATQDAFSFGYDAENRLTSASGTGMSASYAYDGRGRRKTKTVNGTTTVFVTDPKDREILEYDGASGVVQRWFVYGGGVDEVLAQVNVTATHTTSNPRLAMLPDIQGSVTGTMDAGSAVITKIGYSPFGESSTTGGTYRYTGRRIDAETGGLYYYRSRTYDPVTARFLRTDRLGYSAGANLYSYVNNDPLNFIDPTGEFLYPWHVYIGYKGARIAGDGFFAALLKGFGSANVDFRSGTQTADPWSTAQHSMGGILAGRPVSPERTTRYIAALIITALNTGDFSSARHSGEDWADYAHNGQVWTGGRTALHLPDARHFLNDAFPSSAEVQAAIENSAQISRYERCAAAGTCGENPTITLQNPNGTTLTLNPTSGDYVQSNPDSSTFGGNINTPPDAFDGSSPK